MRGLGTNLLIGDIEEAQRNAADGLYRYEVIARKETMTEPIIIHLQLTPHELHLIKTGLETHATAALALGVNLRTGPLNPLLDGLAEAMDKRHARILDLLAKLPPTPKEQR